MMSNDIQQSTKEAATGNSKFPVLSSADLAAAEKLNQMWHAHKAATGATQETARKAMRMSQSSLSNYLGGKLPIGKSALKKFSAYFNCAPGDIREEFIPKSLIDELGTTRKLIERLVAAAKAGPHANREFSEALLESDQYLLSVGANPAHLPVAAINHGTQGKMH